MSERIINSKFYLNIMKQVNKIMYNEFLEKTKYVDYDDPDVKILAEKLKSDAKDELSLIRNAYNFVRDEIKHSWDTQDRRVTAFMH